MKCEKSNKKVVAPHMWVISRNSAGWFMVTLGDSENADSVLKRIFRTEDSIRRWVADHVDSTISVDHVIDTTGLGLVPDDCSELCVVIDEITQEITQEIEDAEG